MNCYRRTKDIWFYLFNRYPSGRWMGEELFTLDFWTDWKYIWQDSVTRYWNLLVKCPITGHVRVRNIADDDEPAQHFCFDCRQFTSNEPLE